MSAWNVQDPNDVGTGSTATSAAFPSSVGALLAEEWSINPLSALPSFLELIMMEEVRRSGRDAVHSSIDIVQQKLSHWTARDTRPGVRRQRQPRQRQQSSEQNLNVVGSYEGREENNGSGSENRSYYWCRRVIDWYRIRIYALARCLSQNLLLPYRPEIVCLVTYAIERWSLSSVSATASEASYGGKRVKLGDKSSSQKDTSSPSSVRLLPMNKRDAIKLAMLAAIGPYFAERIDHLYRRLQQSDGQAQQSSLRNQISRILVSPRTSWKERFLFLYPYIHMSSHFIKLFYQWRYLLGQSHFFDPVSHCLNLAVRRVTVEDQQHQPRKPVAPQITPPRPIPTISPNFSNMTFQKRVALGIVSSAIALGFLARINAERNQRERRRQQQVMSHRNGEGHEVVSIGTQRSHAIFPPPPASSLDNVSKTVRNHSSRTCPLCHQPRVLPTASTSGYVFCLKCLLGYIRERGETCPITRRKCPEARVVRLYEPRHHGRS